jgi:hypothetical protein
MTIGLLLDGGIGGGIPAMVYSTLMTIVLVSRVGLY